MRKKIQITIVVSILTISLFVGKVFAQNAQPVDYKGEPIVDMDLDGLTDQGEIQIYETDPKIADTDGDGFGDGVEISSGTVPSDANSFPGAPVISETSDNQLVQSNETPWAWYVTRASGLLAFLLLYVSIFLGLTLRIPLLRKIFVPVYSMKIHCWISLQATLFALIHGGALMFDKYMAFSLLDVFVPFASKYEPGLVALGIFGFYLMAILVVTSYGRKFLSQKIWRITHFTNVVLYGAVFVHALYLGTDLKNPAFAWLFILANAFLVFIMLCNIELRITDSIKIRRERKIQQQSITTERENN